MLIIINRHLPIYCIPFINFKLILFCYQYNVTKLQNHKIVTMYLSPPTGIPKNIHPSLTGVQLEVNMGRNYDGDAYDGMEELSNSRTHNPPKISESRKNNLPIYFKNMNGKNRWEACS